MVDKPMKTMTAGDVRYIITDAEARASVASLDSGLRAGNITNAALHLGFYLDEDGDLCQLDET